MTVLAERGSGGGERPSPELVPFPAVRFGSAAGDAGALLAPPYDVIDSRQAAELRDRSPYNSVRLILPEGEGPGRHALAARRWRDWLDRGILVEDREPYLYLYRQSFPWEGKRLERRALLAALRLTPFREGAVLPHEETHAAPKEDRLALTLACGAQLSPVFLLAEDPAGVMARALTESEREAEPVLEAETPDGIRHRLGRLPAGPAAAELCARAARAPLLIADGHHRYETALAVRDRLPASGATSHVLACVASEGDPGLRVLPTHRALRTAPPAGSWPEALGGAFSLVSGAAWAGGLAVLEPGSGCAWILRPREAALAAAEITGPERPIPSLLFDRLVLRRTLGHSPEEAVRRGILSYHRDPDAAADAAGREGAAFLLGPVQIADVRLAAAAGRRLPPKSTYFAPKIPSGLLFRRL